MNIEYPNSDDKDILFKLSNSPKVRILGFERKKCLEEGYSKDPNERTYYATYEGVITVYVICEV